MEKKKFKLNIIDIIIIIAVVAVAVFLGSKLIGYGFVPGKDYINQGGEGGAVHTYHVTFYNEKVADYVLENTEIGDSAYSYDDKVHFGKVVAMESSECVEYTIVNGERIGIPAEGYSAAYITLEVEGAESEFGIEVGGELYAPGHTMVIYIGMGKYYMPVYSIEQVD